MDKKEQVQFLADKIQPLLYLIDNFTQTLEDEDIELLKESKDTLESHISFQHSATTLTLAFGIETNTIEEEHKLKTLEILIDLIEERKQYRNDILEEREHQNQLQQNKEELMKIFGNL